MKYFKIIPKALMVTSIMIVMMVACVEDPESIYDEDAEFNLTPVITSVAPDSNFSADNVTFSGIGVVQVIGENFSTIPDYNTVFFSATPGVVLSSSETTLRVRVPNVTGDSIVVKVAVNGALHFGEYGSPYEIKPAVKQIGGFDDLDQLYSLACDETETMWITAFGSPTINVIAVMPDSLKETRFSSLTVASTSFKYGGKDRIFMTGGALLYAMNRVTESFDPSIFLPIAQADISKDVDFIDSTQAFMAIKKAPNFGFVMSVDLDTPGLDTAAAYDSLNIEAIRIYDGDLYVAGSYQVGGVNQTSAVWKNSITGSDLGSRELVLDLADYPGYEGVQITSLTFSADGKMFIGLDAVAAIAVYDNGLLAPFYAPVLSPPTKDLSWGNGNFLYQLTTNRLHKIDMVEAGAPYGGRY